MSQVRMRAVLKVLGLASLLAASASHARPISLDQWASKNSNSQLHDFGSGGGHGQGNGNGGESGSHGGASNDHRGDRSDHGGGGGNPHPTAVAEPGSLGLVLMGVLGVGAAARRRMSGLIGRQR